MVDITGVFSTAEIQQLQLLLSVLIQHPQGATL